MKYADLSHAMREVGIMRQFLFVLEHYQPEAMAVLLSALARRRPKM